MTGTPSLIKRAYNLGLKIVPNIIKALSEEQIKYYENNLDQIPAALERGFVIPPPELPTVTSDGRTGQELIDSLESQEVWVSNWAMDVLTQDEFDREHVTNGVEYDPTVILGSEFESDERTNENIRRVGTDERGFCEPNAEVAALLAEKLSVEDFKRLEEHGIHYLVVMHPAIADSGGDPSLLNLYRGGDELWLNADWGNPEHRWRASFGSVFLPRKSS